MAVTVLDVIDNFTTPSAIDFATIPGTAIEELGELVRQSAAAEQPEATLPAGSVYLGGWPSANFWTVGGDMLLSSLLYSPAVLVRDPITDWFSHEQYRVRHKTSARPGYLDPGGRPNVAATRAFLRSVIPPLRAWRPLIEAGVVVMVTAEDHALAHQTNIAELQGRLEATLLTDPVEYSERFTAGEIAVEDNVRGMFVFAGGDRPATLHRAQRDGLYHFAREYVLATGHGATYTAPFRHEVHLCRNGLSKFTAPSTRVVEAVLRSELPVLHGLTPDVIAKIHDDDGFGAFRRQLHTVYSNVPTEESEENIRRYLLDQEQALLTPELQKAERSADRGPIKNLGVTLTQNVFGFSTGLAAGAITRDPLAATMVGAAGAAAQARLTETIGAAPAQRVWSALVKHQRSVHHELRGVKVQESTPTGSEPNEPFWGIAEVASMHVTVSAGELLIDHFPAAHEQSSVEQPGGYVEGPYRLCECGSGRKFKFCCKPLFRDQHARPPAS